MISVAAGELRRAVKTAARACSDRSPLDCYEKVFLTFGWQSSAMGTDGRSMIRAPLPPAMDEMRTPWIAVVDPARLLLNLVACQDQDEVRINHLGDPDGTERITFDVPGSMGPSVRSSLKYKTPEVIPDLPEPDWASPTAMFSPETFNDMLSLVAPIARRSRGGAMTDAVQIYPVGEAKQIRCTAYDGNRLAQLWIPEAAPTDHVLIPSELIRMLATDARHTKDAIAIIDDGRRIWARIDNVSYVTSAIEGEFPELSGAITSRLQAATPVGTIGADHFLHGLRQAEIVLDAKAHFVGADLCAGEDGRLDFRAESPDRGLCVCSVKANLTAEFAVTVQPSMLTEQLQRLGTETVDIAVINDVAMVLTARDGQYVFMFGSVVRD